MRQTLDGTTQHQAQPALFQNNPDAVADGETFWISDIWGEQFVWVEALVVLPHVRSCDSVPFVEFVNSFALAFSHGGM